MRYVWRSFFFVISGLFADEGLVDEFEFLFEGGALSHAADI